MTDWGIRKINGNREEILTPMFSERDTGERDSIRTTISLLSGRYPEIYVLKKMELLIPQITL